MSNPSDQALASLAGARSSRFFLVTAAIVVAVVAALVVAVALKGAGGGDPLPSATPAAESVEEDLESGVEPDIAGDITSATTLPAVTYEIFLARDPFEPVVPEVVEPVADPDPTSDPGDPNDPNRPTDPGDGTPVVPREPSNPRCVGDEELVCDGRVITLLDVTTISDQQVAVIQVGTTIHEVLVGQSFADNLEVRAIDGSSVTIAFGDVTFVLRAGGSVLK